MSDNRCDREFVEVYSVGDHDLADRLVEAIEAKLADFDDFDFLFLDLETGEFEAGQDEGETYARLAERTSTRVLYGRRVGFPWLHRWPPRMAQRISGRVDCGDAGSPSTTRLVEMAATA